MKCLLLTVSFWHQALDAPAGSRGQTSCCTVLTFLLKGVESWILQKCWTLHIFNVTVF